MAIHYCDKCGKEMVRTAKCEFYCSDCDNTIFDFSLQSQCGKPTPLGVGWIA